MAAPLDARCAPLDLLDEPWPFSQAPLLNAEEFAKAATYRRINLPGQHDLDVNALEELHRAGLLVPLVSVDRSHTPRTGRAGLEAVHRGEPLSDRTVLLVSARASGNAADAAAAPYSGWAQSGREYFYSTHQFLGLAHLTGFLAAYECIVDGSRTKQWRLADDRQPSAKDLTAAAAWRKLAAALTFMDTAFRPQITRQLHGVLAAWRDHREAYDSRGAMRRFGDQPEDERIHQAVAALRITAAHVDDLGDFYDVVRRSDGEKWESLRGGARLALDFRIAAEMLELCAIDAGYTLPEFPPNKVPLHQQGLRHREESLDAALTRLRLSPHPSVVLAVEGQTEELLIPRVLKLLLGTAPARELITVDCFGGADKDLTALARYAATPVPGTDVGDAVLLDRPVTRFLILVDAEGKYRTPEAREKQRFRLLTEIAKQLPPDLRSEILDPAANHVEIRTWGLLPFEFEHFTDEELTDALEAAAGGSHPVHDRSALVDAVRRERERREPDIEHAWAGEGPWKVTDGPRKVQIADALWPTLERKITEALENGQPAPPMMDGALRAVELGLKTPRSGVALFRRKPSQGT